MSGAGERWVFKPWVTSALAGDIKTIDGDLIAQTVTKEHAEQIVADHDASARLAASEARVRELEAALETIRRNVKGLAEGRQPNLSENAVFYFRLVSNVCNAALRGAEGREGE